MTGRVGPTAYGMTILTALLAAACGGAGDPSPGPVRPNHAPVAANDAAATGVSAPVVVDVLANDADADGDPLSISDVRPGAHGSVANQGASLTYSPDAGFSGGDAFTYTVSDGRGGTDTAIVLVTVSAGAGSYPVATPLAALHADEDAAVSFTLTGTDAEDAETSLTVTIASEPAHGSLAVASGGAPLFVTYTPSPNYAGPDAFTFRVTDRDGNASAPVAVSIAVAALNDLPVAAAVAPLTTPEDTPATVLLTGTDVEDPTSSLAVAVVTAPTHGTLDTSGGAAPRTVTYTPAADFSGPDSLTYRVTDRDGGQSELVTVQLTVTAVNDLPVATPVAPVTTDEDSAVDVVLAASDLEDGPGALTIEVVTAPTRGAVSPSSGPAPLRVTYTPAADLSGSDSFTYRVTDSLGGQSGPATVSITVSEINDPPSASPATAVVLEDSAPQAVTLTGTDPESTATSLDVQVLTQPAHGTIGATGGKAPLLVEYTPDANWSGADAFTFQVTDPGGAPSAPATVEITVTGVNDLPVAAAVPPVTLAEDGSAEVVLGGTDVEDATPSLTVAVVTAPAHGTVSLASGNAPLTVTYVPSPDWAGADSFTFRLTDSTGGVSAPSTVSIAVTAVNDAPVARDDAATACAGASADVFVLANDRDVDGDALALSGVTQGAHGTVTSAAGKLTYTPDAGWTGADTFTYTVSDGGGASAQGTVQVVSSLATISSVFPASGSTGQPLQLHGDCLGSASGAVTIGGRTAAIETWTPSYVVAVVPLDFAPGSHAVVATPSAGAAAAATYRVVPWIAVVDPAWAAPGEAQSASGDALESAGSVSYGTTAAAVDGWTNTALQSRVPAALVAGPVGVTARSSSGASTNAYPVTIAGHDTWLGHRIPYGREEHTAVWTGTEMIVWGGKETGGLDRLGNGGRYNPRFDAWAPVSSIAAPSKRVRHTAVWTGTEMIVWGGYSGGAMNTGARYDPAADTWTAVTTAGAPSARDGHSAVWTGTQMIVWGGTQYSSYHANGGRYDPAAGTWAAISTANAPAGRAGHHAVWTGREMIVWGGRDGSGNLVSGARYDPVTDTWVAMSTAGAPSPRAEATAVWTGTELVVFGGYDGTSALGTGARYDPRTDTWRATSPSGSRRLHSAVWTGTEMIVWGGWTTDYTRLTWGRRYDPVTDSWSGVSSSGEPGARMYHTAVWTGAEMIVWGGNGGTDTGGRYAPRADTWRPVRAAAPGEPAKRTSHTGVWTGTELLVWGGSASGIGYTNTGGRYRPAADAWTPMSTAGAPSPRAQHVAVWTGTELIVWGGLFDDGSTQAFLADGARYDPASDTWTPLSTVGAPSPRIRARAVWTGKEMIVWGGYGPARTQLGGGARYDPATDTWSPVSATNEPAPREFHTAVWTGTEMIVWGGQAPTSSLNTGGRYDPVTDAWTATTTVGAPAGRQSHTAVWTGTEMIVWGGEAGTDLSTGASFDPATGAWTALPATGGGRATHTAVWTGTEMIVWGGHGWGDFLNDGKRYDPSTRTWTAVTLAGAPQDRQLHTAVWTGTEMIVWGGALNGWGMGGLGRYVP